LPGLGAEETNNMPKTATFTTITPLPAGITRQSVLDMYRDHLAMIDLNPLVVERFKCKPPGYAPTDEYWAMWYTIKDKVSYLPGGLATGSVSYHACFHDLPDGLETHVYAPLGLDIRGKWSVGGSLPGEPKPPPVKGIPTPRHGLYIREDVKMTCSSILLSFVKRTFKDSHASLVEQLVERAHIMESSFANERLKALRNVDPAERMAIGDIFIAPPPDYQYEEYQPPLSQTQSQPASIQRQRSHTSPPQALPIQSSHSRSHSDPIASPGLSSASTLVEDIDRLRTRWKEDDREMISQFSNVEPPPSRSASSEPSMYLLPSTTFNGAQPQPQPERKRVNLSLFPPLRPYDNAERVISLHPHRSAHSRNESQVSNYPPRVSYTPEERPISFVFPMPESEFDTISVSATAASQQNILDEIDDAIDQMCFYNATHHPEEEVQPAHEILPATKYEPSPSPTKRIAELSPTRSTKPASPRPHQHHKRQDSCTPDHNKELPPLPVDQD